MSRLRLFRSFARLFRWSYQQPLRATRLSWSFFHRRFAQLPKLTGPPLLGIATAYCLRHPLATDGYQQTVMEAARDNNVELLKRLINKKVDINQRHPHGWSPLHVAAFHGNLEVVMLLLANGADINVADDFTSVQQVAMERRTNFLEVVFEREINFTSRFHFDANYQGCTALHYATLGDQLELIKFLLESGADPTVENRAGHVAADYSRDESTREQFRVYSEQYEKKKQVLEAEERRKFPLENRIKQHLVGQEGAISAVAAAIRRKENGWSDDEHPLVFLFLGSSGIGKTELAKQVAAYLHPKDSKKGFIRIDMTEYQQQHEVAKFIGSPPGYVGHEEGGQLTKKLTECPTAVVLFDEVEKAHPDILTILLQLFDEGRMTDGQGKTIECRSAIFIMTSNLASEEIGRHGAKLREEAEKIHQGKMAGSVDDINIAEKIQISADFKEKVVQPILKRHFRRDEFLGRINEFVFFLPFSRAELKQLCTKELEFWRQKALKKQIQLDWQKEVLDVLIDEGYNIRYGARSIKHEVERRVVNKLAAAHERQLITEGSAVRIVTDYSGDKPVSSDGHRIELEILESTGRKVLNVPLSESMLESTPAF